MERKEDEEIEEERNAHLDKKGKQREQQTNLTEIRKAKKDAGMHFKFYTGKQENHDRGAMVVIEKAYFERSRSDLSLPSTPVSQLTTQLSRTSTPTNLKSTSDEGASYFQGGHLESSFQNLIERKALEKDIKEKLEKNNYCILQGRSGCGKTTLGEKFLRDFYGRGKYSQQRRNYFISAEKIENIREFFIRIAIENKLLDDNASKSLGHDGLRKILRKFGNFSTYSNNQGVRGLILFDNVNVEDLKDNNSELMKYIEFVRSKWELKVIVTVAAFMPAPHSQNAVTIEDFTIAEAKQRALDLKVANVNDADIEWLKNEIGLRPLLLERVLCDIVNSTTGSIATLRQKGIKANLFANLLPPTSYIFKEEGRDGYQLLLNLTLLEHSALSGELVEKLFEEINNLPASNEEDACSATLQALMRNCYLKRLDTNNLYSVHRDIALALREKASQHSLTEAFKVVANLLNALFIYDRHNLKDTLASSRAEFFHVEYFLSLCINQREIIKDSNQRAEFLKLLRNDNLIALNIGALLGKVADFFYFNGLYNQCIEYTHQVERFLENQQDSKALIIVAKACHVRGNAFDKMATAYESNREQFTQDALYCYLRAEELFSQIADPATIFDFSMAVQCHANMLCKSKNIEAGQKKYDEACKMLANLPRGNQRVDKNLAIIQHELGSLYLRESKNLQSQKHPNLHLKKEELIDKAIECYSSSVYLKETTNAPLYYLAITHYKLALAYHIKAELHPKEERKLKGPAISILHDMMGSMIQDMDAFSIQDSHLINRIIELAQKLLPFANEEFAELVKLVESLPEGPNTTEELARNSLSSSYGNSPASSYTGSSPNSTPEQKRFIYKVPPKHSSSYGSSFSRNSAASGSSPSSYNSVHGAYDFQGGSIPIVADNLGSTPTLEARLPSTSPGSSPLLSNNQNLPIAKKEKPSPKGLSSVKGKIISFFGKGQ